MCDYCNTKYNIHSRMPVVDFYLDFGILGKTSMQAYIKEYDYKSYLDVALDSYGLNGSTIRKTAEINFCPQCGRNLRKN